MSDETPSPPLMLCAEATRASRSPTLVRGEASRTNDTSGPSSRESLARFDPATQSWKTSQLTFLSGSETFSETWPASGMMRSGQCFRRASWVPHIHASACSSLPTPNATAFKGGRLSPRKGVRNPEKNNYQDFCSLVLKMRYPLPEFGEQVMGFPLGWTLVATEQSGTPSSPPSPKSSAD